MAPSSWCRSSVLRPLCASRTRFRCRLEQLVRSVRVPIVHETDTDLVHIPSRYQSAITLCAEISAAATVIQFWDQETKYSPAIWITLIIVLIIALNIFAVAIYGEAEFIFASIKIVTIIGLLIAGLVIFLGGAPDHDRRGFRYWKEGVSNDQRREGM